MTLSIIDIDISKLKFGLCLLAIFSHAMFSVPEVLRRLQQARLTSGRLRFRPVPCALRSLQLL
jgi:hypothetical protein